MNENTENRRSTDPSDHVDLTSVWIVSGLFSAAVVLAYVYVLAATAGVR